MEATAAAAGSGSPPQQQGTKGPPIDTHHVSGDQVRGRDHLHLAAAEDVRILRLVLLQCLDGLRVSPGFVGFRGSSRMRIEVARGWHTFSAFPSVMTPTVALAIRIRTITPGSRKACTVVVVVERDRGSLGLPAPGACLEAPLPLKERDGQVHDCRCDKDLDEEVVKLLRDQLPERLGLVGRELVPPMEKPSLEGGRFRQRLLLISIHQAHVCLADQGRMHRRRDRERKHQKKGSTWATSDSFLPIFRSTFSFAATSATSCA